MSRHDAGHVRRRNLHSKIVFEAAPSDSPPVAQLVDELASLFWVMLAFPRLDRFPV